MTTRELLLIAWAKDPFVISITIAALLAYGVHVRGRFDRRAGFFAAAALIFLLALASPIGVLARSYLFSAHMLQHLLLVLVVPPLALLALPRVAETSAKQAGSASLQIRNVAPWVAGVGAMWLWHAPTLCNAASQNLSVQRLQTVSLVSMGTMFFWPILGPRVSRRLSPFAGMIYLFAACSACTVLGVLVTFSPVEVCSVYANPVDHLGALSLLRNDWGMTAKIDQEIGGLLMWVPGCMLYAGCILGMYARYARGEHRVEEAQDAPGIAAADPGEEGRA